ncbi:MAG: hypothetical protein QOI15_2531 [Pseudonocardiales bacterium]|nr:hypothetical protein [Pseudonocardiales bacterium]
MFIQVIQAKAKDEAGLRAALDRWQETLQPDAKGWLGTTAGITEDGRFIALARFESADAARANSDRPEQGEWFADVAEKFDGEPEFLDSERVEVFLDGGSDDAGFVQIMRGQSDDVRRMHDVMSAHDDSLREGRPDIIGGLMIEGEGGRYVDAIYFRSEDAARQGEGTEPPEEIRAELDEGWKLMGDITYFDLKDPILRSP